MTTGDLSDLHPGLRHGKPAGKIGDAVAQGRAAFEFDFFEALAFFLGVRIEQAHRNVGQRTVERVAPAAEIELTGKVSHRAFIDLCVTPLEGAVDAPSIAQIECAGDVGEADRDLALIKSHVDGKRSCIEVGAEAAGRTPVDTDGAERRFCVPRTAIYRDRHGVEIATPNDAIAHALGETPLRRVTESRSAKDGFTVARLIPLYDHAAWSIRGECRAVPYRIDGARAACALPDAAAERTIKADGELAASLARHIVDTEAQPREFGGDRVAANPPWLQRCGASDRQFFATAGCFRDVERECGAASPA